MSRLFAISDIHGCYIPFYELVINRIGLKKSDKLILLGDYIDRGDQSKEVVDLIIDLIDKGFDITPLTGNHEVMLVEASQNQELLPLWFLNSGMDTLQSFNIEDLRELSNKYLIFFSNLKYFEKVGDFFFVHAGFNDHEADPFNDKHGMIWECHPTYDNPLLTGKTIIHGHRPKTLAHVEKVLHEKSRVIPIDTGCVYREEPGYGNLSALEINSMKLITVANLP